MLMLATAPAASAQELGVMAERAWTDAAGWNDPHGWGAAAVFPLHPHVAFRLAVSRSTGGWERDERICSVYGRVGVNCDEERVVTETTASDINLVVLAGAGGERFWVGAGPGVSLTELDVDDVSDSGRPTRLVRPSAGQGGVLGLAHLRVRPVDGLPVGITAEFSWQRVSLNGCARESWNTDLYCGEARFAEARVGLAWLW